MERLQFGDRNKLIVSSQDVIWTVNTQTAETELLAGVRGTTGFQDVEPLNGEPYPLFNTVRGFIVLNETHLLLADTNNHCLRFLNMLTSATSTYAGECTQMGQEDGYLKEQARFNKPTVIIRQEFFLFYILDQGSSRVRSIDWRESPRNRVHTYRVLEPYAKLADHQISSMIFSGSDYAFISHRKQGIARFSRSTNDLLEEKDVELLTSGIQGQVDGEISTAQFGVVLDIAFLHGTDEVLIVLDEWNQPRYINLTEGLVYPGNQSLTFNTPICVLSMEECVYIGGSFGIQCTHPDDIRGKQAATPIHFHYDDEE